MQINFRILSAVNMLETTVQWADKRHRSVDRSNRSRRSILCWSLAVVVICRLVEWPFSGTFILPYLTYPDSPHTPLPPLPPLAVPLSGQLTHRKCRPAYSTEMPPVFAGSRRVGLTGRTEPLMRCITSER